jgi:hypothetical protein
MSRLLIYAIVFIEGFLSSIAGSNVTNVEL